jgi:sugar phosphate isomerase/epimerase
LELGSKYLVSKTASNTREEDMRACELFNYLGEKCKVVGIQHVLHTGIPHYNDQKQWNLDVIAEETDPDLVKYELDTYWCLRSDHDVIETIKKYGDRIIFIHQKDLPKDFKGKIDLTDAAPPGGTWAFFDHVNKEDFIEIGEGKIDHQTHVDAAIRYTRATHIILEQDFTKLDEIESIRISMNNFRKMKNIEIER